MKKNKNKKKKKKREQRLDESTKQKQKCRNGVDNYLTEAAKGCYVAHYDSKWILGKEIFHEEDFTYSKPEDIPDISIDPELNMLSVINSSSEPRSYYITLGDNHTAYDRRKKKMEKGFTRDENGTITLCTTLIVVVEPLHIMDVCYISSLNPDIADIHSDIKSHSSHPNPSHYDPTHSYPFPLGGTGPYLCTQAWNGKFTHFYAGNYHAVDFRAPVGTDVVAVGDGTIVDVRQDNNVSGIHVRNLFLWNSVMIHLESGEFAEYVHIKAGSVTMKVGDKVNKGQKICETGDVGFCPEPHLHFQMHLSDEKTAPTIMFAFKNSKGEDYFPEVGKYYNGNGEAT